MTNTIAIWLGALILLAVAADQVMEWGVLIFLFRRMGDLIEWMAVWR